MTDDSGTTPARMTAERLWFLALSVVAGLVALSGLVSAASVSPVFCGLCHSSERAALQASAHAGTHCDSCHVSSGPLGLVEQRVSVVAMIPAAPLELLGVRRSGSATVDRGRCEECHESMIPTTIVVDGIRMNHRAPNEQGWTCTRCHGGIGHPGEEHLGTYSMEMCLACHTANPENITSCETCHAPGEEGRPAVETTPWRVTHGSNWRSTHGMGTLQSCRSCHAQDYCVACHGIPIPHSERYLSDHGADALPNSGKRQYCFDCHSESSCEGCHGVEMPHPDDFAPNHKETIAESGQEVCARCHDTEQCDECHVRHTHPGLTQERIESLKSRPVEVE